jgi:hypothetical protein
MNNIYQVTDPKSRMVSGPVNIIRLEGNVHGIAKVLYLFMDYHVPVANQTQCENLFSQDVQKYFTQNFYKAGEGTKIYDFFLEIYPSELADENNPQGIQNKEYKEIYIEEVVKMFRKIFNYDSKKNKVQVNKLFKNVRLHYLDVRDYYKHNVHHRVSEMVNIAHRFRASDNIDLRGLDRIVQLMQLMRDHLAYIVDILSGKYKSKSSTPKIIKKNNRKNLDIEAIEYLTNKMKTSYNHADIKKAMLKLIDNTINNFTLSISEIDDAMKRFLSYGNMISNSGNRLIRDENTSYIYTYGLSSYTIRDMIVDILNSVESLVDERFVEFFARFTDIYFLRRFLDKDYITNAITYSGALHSNTYIHFLVTMLDFKVTHASYSKISNMTKLTDEIKRRSPMEIQELILPHAFQQCSDMNNFPKEFL